MADITVRRGLIGEEDLSLGEGSFTRYSPLGASETKTKINASNLPLTAVTGALFNPVEDDIDGAISSMKGDLSNFSAKFLPPLQWPFAVATALWEYEYTAFSFQDYNAYNDTSLAMTDESVDASTAANQIKLYNNGNVLFARLQSDGTIYQLIPLDEDDFASNSATIAPSQQSVAAYLDEQISLIGR